MKSVVSRVSGFEPIDRRNYIDKKLLAMDYIARNVTQNLLHKLPDNESHFKLNDLEGYGLPDFVVDRIQVELENNLAESLIPPDTDWANMHTEAVQFAWNQFVRAIRAEARLPASYASTVMETAVGDILDIMIQPRKNIPEIMYGPDEKLGYDELLQRTHYVVVYSYLADAVTRYMRKKEVDELSKERCAKIISRIDEKLTGKYTPLNWAQLLDPWFNLIGDELDTEALRLFFEDKERPKIARLFEQEEGPVNRTRVIEILSSPDLSLSDNEGGSSAQQPLQEPSLGSKSEESESTGTSEFAGKQSIASEAEEVGKEEDSRIDEKFKSDADAKLEEAKRRLEQLKAEGPVLSGESDEDENEKEVEDTPKSEASGSTSWSPEDAPGSEEEEDENEESFSLSDQYSDDEEDEPEADTDSSEAGLDNSDEPAQKVDEDDDEEEEGEEDAPIWKRFMSEEDEDAGAGDEEVSAQKADEDEVDRLINFLSYDEDRFVRDLFNGEEEDYREALSQLASFTDWKSAGRYLHKHIFTAYDIDMYEETAVDFTDELQEFFTEQK